MHYSRTHKYSYFYWYLILNKMNTQITCKILALTNLYSLINNAGKRSEDMYTKIYHGWCNKLIITQSIIITPIRSHKISSRNQSQRTKEAKRVHTNKHEWLDHVIIYVKQMAHPCLIGITTQNYVDVLIYENYKSKIDPI
jgi:hypothetical protein